MGRLQGSGLRKAFKPREGGGMRFMDVIKKMNTDDLKRAATHDAATLAAATQGTATLGAATHDAATIAAATHDAATRNAASRDAATQAAATHVEGGVFATPAIGA
eukprot:CAMPEP_0173111604 /NCGR_PEP_ID=MMETSP1102-20130122/45311_1 /TAXON_ID=49646 /ORGANISM="Geminigera sp., Strain Caron Lab Isolate" /LENGTH=104 /DNA_ID=CAMNT_0014012095 /DNA_START=272 /DNA_END=582 /DNA_ORIENTATION=-